MAERIRANLAKRNIVKRQTGETIGAITLSVGVASYEFGESINELVKRADAALYGAKGASRNRVMTQAEMDEVQKSA